MKPKDQIYLDDYIALAKQEGWKIENCAERFIAEFNVLSNVEDYLTDEELDEFYQDEDSPKSDEYRKQIIDFIQHNYNYVL
jgi:hypothetical protein